MKLNRSFVFLLFIFLCKSNNAESARSMVLVTSKECPIDSISSFELRKIYFGLPVTHNQFVINGLLNISDDQLHKRFLQIVAAMSKKSYKRRLLLNTLHYGSPRILEFYDKKDLIIELKKSICSVTYMWDEGDEQSSELKKIRLLWQAN